MGQAKQREPDRAKRVADGKLKRAKELEEREKYLADLAADERRRRAAMPQSQRDAMALFGAGMGLMLGCALQSKSRFR